MEFVARIVNGRLEFATKSMTKKWGRVQSFYERTGTYFKINVEELEKQTTEGQVRLFKRIVLMVCEDTGNDYNTVQKEFLKLTPYKESLSLFGEIKERNKTLEEITTKEFQKFLEDVIVYANDIMGTKITMHHDKNLGTVILTENEDNSD